MKFPQQFDDTYPVGFRMAMNALHRNKYSLIVPACEMEIKLNGEYVDESCLLRAQMHHLLLPFGSATKQTLSNDFDELKRMLKATPSRNDDFTFEIKLLMCRIHFKLEEYTKKSTKSNAYVIFASEPILDRCGIVHFWQGYDMCSSLQSCDILKGLELLRRSLKLMGPRFYVGHFYVNIFDLTSKHFDYSSKPNTTSNPVDEYISRLGKIHLFFPNEIAPVKLLINYHIQNKAYKIAAIYVQTIAKLSQQTTDDASNIVDANTTNQSELELIIDYLKSVIRDDPEEYAAYDALIVIYSEQTHEYAKCLEAFTKALMEIRDQRLYRQLFQRRQKLLNSIVAANFWSEM